MFLQSPVQLAHSYWDKVLRPGDHVLDCTCGNGYDTLFLAKKVLENEDGFVTALDIQEKALQNTSQLLREHLSEKQLLQTQLRLGCHSKIDDFNLLPLNLVVYNLGYLPGDNKEIITTFETTLSSLEKAVALLRRNGLISVICYPGHSGGDLEEREVLKWASKLSKAYICCHHRWLNRSKTSPSLILIQKK